MSVLVYSSSCCPLFDVLYADWHVIFQLIKFHLMRAHVTFVSWPVHFLIYELLKIESGIASSLFTLLQYLKKFRNPKYGWSMIKPLIRQSAEWIDNTTGETLAMWITRISSCRTWVEIVMRKIRFVGVCRYFCVSLWQLRAQLTPQDEAVLML